MVRSSRNELEEGGNKLGLIPLRREVIEHGTLKSNEKAQKEQKKAKGKKKEVDVARRDEEPKEKDDEEYQFNLEIQISNAEAKRKGIHLMKINQWERKVTTFIIIVVKRVVEIEEEFRRKPPTQ